MEAAAALQVLAGRRNARQRSRKVGHNGIVDQRNRDA